MIMRREADIVVREGTVVTADGTCVADVLISDGRVVALDEPGTGHAASAVEARGLLVIPGVVDMHVHLREPGLTHKEDVTSGTQAAACGGTTTVADMPNTLPPVSTLERFEEKVETVKSSCWVDLGLWAGGTDVSELERMHAAGAVGIKLYMVSGPGFEELYTADDETLARIVALAARLHWLICAHVGDETGLAREREELIAAGRRDPWAFIDLQRGPASQDGLRRFLEAGQKSQAPVHVAHLSIFGPEALEQVRAFRARGLRVTVETQLPALGTEDVSRLRIFALANGQEDQLAEMFWRALAEGEIDVAATDHAPHTRLEKDLGFEDVWVAPPGYPAVETALPLAFDAVLRGKWAITRLVDAMAAKPAALLGLDQKGQIELGRDADLVLLDPNGTRRVDETRLHSKVGWSPFHGRELRGHIHATVLRGEIIARDGEIVTDAPRGQFIRRHVERVQAPG